MRKYGVQSTEYPPCPTTLRSAPVNPKDRVRSTYEVGGLDRKIGRNVQSDGHTLRLIS